jgi:integrase
MLGLYHHEGFVFPTRNGTPMTMSNLRRAFGALCKNAGLGDGWTTYELRYSFVSLVSDQLDDLVKVADLAGHVDTQTTEGYRHSVRPALPHAVEAWNGLLARSKGGPSEEVLEGRPNLQELDLEGDGAEVLWEDRDDVVDPGR